MKNELKNLLLEMKNITEDINHILELEDDYMLDLENALKVRQAIIEKISLMDYEKEEFKDIVESIGLFYEEEKLGSLLSSKKELIKKEIDENRKEIIKKKSQKAFRYKFENKNPIDPVFLSKKY